MDTAASAPPPPPPRPGVRGASRDFSDAFFYFVAVVLGLSFSLVLLLLAWSNSIQDGTCAFSLDALRVNQSAHQNLRAVHAGLEAAAAFLAEVPPGSAASGFNAFAARLRASNPFVTGLVWYQSDHRNAGELHLMGQSSAVGVQFPALLARRALLSWESDVGTPPDDAAVMPRLLPPAQSQLGYYWLVRAVPSAVRAPGGENWVVAEIDVQSLLGEPTAQATLDLRLYLESEGIAGRTLLLARPGRTTSPDFLRVRELDDTAHIRFERYSMRLLSHRNLFWHDLSQSQLFTATVLGLGVTLLLIALARARARQAFELASRARLVEEQVARQTHQLAAARDEAIAVSRVKSDFLAAMSHEIRTPLNAILGMAELLGQTSLVPDQSRYVAVLGHAGVALLDIVNDTLDLAKMDALQLKLDAIAFDLAALITGAAEMHAVQAASKGLDLAVILSADLPAGVVGDPSRLRQILLNLIGNALKFTEHGYLRIEARLARAEEPPGAVTICVRDSGIGIPAARLEAVFQSFTQADASVTRKYGGTGLGLTIARRLVELMGGQLLVRSTENQGSEFWFSLVFAPAPSQWREELAGAAPVARPPSRLSGAAGDARLRVLLVEDNLDNRLLISAFLRDEALELEEAQDGAAAVACVQARRYDLILMDIQMPVMDGLTATREIRRWERARGRPPVPIIALTAHAVKEDEDKSLAAGCSAHLTKPIRKQVLLAAIYQHTQAASTWAQIAST